MKVSYRGFTIDAHREESLGGDVNLYYAVFRDSDNWEFTSGFTSGADTIRYFITHLKSSVDDFFTNPNDYDDPARRDRAVDGVGCASLVEVGTDLQSCTRPAEWMVGDDPSRSDCIATFLNDEGATTVVAIGDYQPSPEVLAHDAWHASNPDEECGDHCNYEAPSTEPLTPAEASEVVAFARPITGRVMYRTLLEYAAIAKRLREREEEIAHLHRQRDDLQAANTREVERRRAAERKLGGLIRDATPALRHRSEHYPERFKGRVPKRVRITARGGVIPDGVLALLPENRGLVCDAGEEYDATTNSHGAVAAILPDGRQLGLRPHEFEVTEWYETEVRA